MCQRIITEESVRQQEEIAKTIAITDTITDPINTTDDRDPSAVVAPPKNYLKEFYSNPSLEFDVFASSRATHTAADEKITELTKEINKVTKKLKSLGEELSETYSKKYSSIYTPITERVIIEYSPRSYNKDKLFFEMSTGMRITEDSINKETDLIYKIYAKHESRYILAGYVFDVASVVVKDVDFSISTDNLKIKSQVREEYAFSLLKPDDPSSVYSSHISCSSVRPYWLLPALDSVNPNTFINTIYGVSRNFKFTDLNHIYRAIKENVNFELIVKQAPDEIMEELIREDCSTVKPLHELCGLDKETYREACKRNLISETRSLAKVFEARTTLKKTPSEIFSLLDKFKTYEKDLSFYSIAYEINWPLSNTVGRCKDAKLFGLLAGYYMTYPTLNTHYSFGKYADYVVQETINQGYSSINSFVSELKDYLDMCALNSVTPSLFSSYLKQTHDIASRNSRLSVSAEDEEKFKHKYDGFKPFKCTIKLKESESEEESDSDEDTETESTESTDSKSTKYIVIAPDSTLSVKDEGCQLNHCVASYIKRVIDGDCLIYFLRTDEKTSLITLEVEENTIVQARGMHNRFPDEEEAKAIKKFAEKRGMICDY